MYRIGDLVKITGQYRNYLVVEVNDKENYCIVKYIYGNPETTKGIKTKFEDIEFIDHLNI